MNTSIEQYSNEIGLKEAMTMEELIQSHRNLRQLNSNKQKDWLDAIEKARNMGFENGKREALEQNFISRKTLKAMTIQQLIEWLE